MKYELDIIMPDKENSEDVTLSAVCFGVISDSKQMILALISTTNQA